MAADGDGKIAASYHLNNMNLPAGLKDTRGAVIDHEFTERTTFIVMPDYRIAAVRSTADDKITPAQHVEKALEVLKQGATQK